MHRFFRNRKFRRNRFTICPICSCFILNVENIMSEGSNGTKKRLTPVSRKFLIKISRTVSAVFKFSWYFSKGGSGVAYIRHCARAISILFLKTTVTVSHDIHSLTDVYFSFFAGRKESDFDVGPVGVVRRQSAQHNRRYVDRRRFLRKRHHRHIHIDRDSVRRIPTRDR